MIKILVAEEAPALRDTLVTLLDLEDDLEVVAAVASGDRVLAVALDHRPDVAVLDMDLPGLDGLSAAVELHRRLADCRVLILTGLGRPGYLRRAVEARASAFLHKDGPADRLIDAVRRIARGEVLTP